MKIKDQDLHEITKELIDEALELDCAHKDKICNFVFNLLNNGGNKTRAALDAGYGDASTDEGRKVACVQAQHILAKVSVKALYDKLSRYKLSSDLFGKVFNKQHLIYILYQMGMNFADKNAKQSIAAFKEAATLSGFYQDDALAEATNAMAKAEEVANSVEILQDWFNKKDVVGK